MKKVWAVVTASVLVILAVVGATIRGPIAVNGLESKGGVKSLVSNSLEKVVGDEIFTVGDASYSFEELGISFDKNELRKAVNSGSILWPPSWGVETIIPYEIKEQTFNETIEKDPNVYPPVNATAEREEDSFIVAKGKDGYTVTPEMVLTALEKGDRKVFLEVVPPVDDAALSTEVERLNSLVKGISIIVDEDTVGSLSGEEVADAFVLEGSEVVAENPQSGGTFELLLLKYSLNSQAVDSLSKKVVELSQKDSVDGVAVVDDEGEVLKVLEEWSDGFVPKRSEIPVAIEEALNSTGEVKVPGDVISGKFEGKFREAVINRGERMSYFYENGELVNSFPVAVGKPGWDTTVGSYRVHTQLVTQDMGCNRPDLDYCTPDVPWISYFNGDQGFHGAYWHSDFGNPSSSAVSHGCVNMQIPSSKWVYEFLQVGSPVTVNP